ncbi:hypothetical protein CCHR01_13103 [Colletotrichum chrysophilum]|uniref:Uncharacterized protein n=1 Tax=Colletotrichum chrysophilum TaxID=1836956 RepID=A0AAD9ACT4_9PEZI|nr:hypothetical protein CCHR01_13103 [Colletotrichum chrysophilum]
MSPLDRRRHTFQDEEWQRSALPGARLGWGRPSCRRQGQLKRWSTLADWQSAGLGRRTLADQGPQSAAIIDSEQPASATSPVMLLQGHYSQVDVLSMLTSRYGSP